MLLARCPSRWRNTLRCSGRCARASRSLTLRSASWRAAGYPFDWGGGTFKRLLRGKPGPGGGFEATPKVLALLLTGYLLDCPRREAAAKALGITFAACQKVPPFMPAAPRPLSGKKSICAKTGERYCGAAVVAVLSDRALFEQAVQISVSADLGVAQLIFVDHTTSFFTPAYYAAKPGLRGEAGTLQRAAPLARPDPPAV